MQYSVLEIKRFVVKISYNTTLAIVTIWFPLSMDHATVALSHISTVYTLFCPCGGLHPSKPPWIRIISLYPWTSNSCGRGACTSNTIKYDCYRNIPRSAPMGRLSNPPGLGLYPSIPEPQRRVTVLHVPQTCNTTRCGWQRRKDYITVL